MKVKTKKKNTISELNSRKIVEKMGRRKKRLGRNENLTTGKEKTYIEKKASMKKIISGIKCLKIVHIGFSAT